MATERVTSVWVDLNSRSEGFVPAYQDDADGLLQVGSMVYAWDEFEPGLRAPAVVVAFDESSGRALLDVKWEATERDDATASSARFASADLFLTLRESLEATDWRIEYPSQGPPAPPRVRESHQPA
jgi:hypothetical protein